MAITAAKNKTDSDSTEPSLRVEPRSLVSLCKAAADPLRLDIMRVLSKDSFGVQELAGIFSVPQPGMSHHLKILFKSGLLVTRRQGNSIFYRRALLKGETELDTFQAQLYATLDAIPLQQQWIDRMSDVYKERSLQSREYFERNSARFSENQGMLCELDQYMGNFTELLDLVHLKNKKTSRVMEIGPGQGDLLKELSGRFQTLVALDSSEEMLGLTKGQLGAKLRDIEFVNASLETYTPGEKTFDAVVLNMVLHHMSSPARAFQKLGSLVHSGGYAVIADLCSHDQEWAREKCGDVWLGFDPQDLSDWGKSAGFDEEQGSYLGLKNGFQIQLKLFRKK